MLSKTGLQAIKALAYLADLPGGIYEGAASIAQKTGGGQNYLGKVLQLLSREGLVLSQKGLGGGFRLARSADAISLYEVVDPIEHVSRWSGCFMGQGECTDRDPCAVHNQWKVLRENYLRFLMETSIADLSGRKVSGLPE
jgi:Rrf2 family protein